jgi:hypothetical protein
MGIGTGAIGLIPTYEAIGVTAAFLLFGLRMIQGLCLGGEYGGAITYVAEHVSDDRRGYYTGWLQTSPTLGDHHHGIATRQALQAASWWHGPHTRPCWRSAPRR